MQFMTGRRKGNHMLIQEEVSVVDWLKGVEDFTPGDKVCIRASGSWVSGVISEAGVITGTSAETLSIQTVRGSVTYTESTLPPIDEVLQCLYKIPPLHMLERGTYLSRVTKTPDWEWYREYAEVTDIVRIGKGYVREVTLSIMNGPNKDDILELSTNSEGTIQHKLAGWEIEE